MVKRLLKRYHDSFNIIDDISAEKTISMWIQDHTEIEPHTDGSAEWPGDNHYYKLKQ
jgi:hypothetical protein